MRSRRQSDGGTAALYPDLAGRGLSAALRVELQALGSDVEPSWDPPLALWGQASRGSRSAQAAAAAEERSFGFDLWAEGVEYFSGRSADLRDVAAAIHFWLGDADADGETAAARFPFLALHEFARAYERGDAIEARWRSYLGERSGLDPLFPLIEAAAAEPRLRRLFPYTSMDTLMFSRWVGYPFSNDLPSATPNFTPADAVALYAQTRLSTGETCRAESSVQDAIRAGTYRVSDAETLPLGEGDAARAVELLAAALPERVDVVYRRPHC